MSTAISSGPFFLVLPPGEVALFRGAKALGLGVMRARWEVGGTTVIAVAPAGSTVIVGPPQLSAAGKVDGVRVAVRLPAVTPSVIAGAVSHAYLRHGLTAYRIARAAGASTGSARRLAARLAASNSYYKGEIIADPCVSASGAGHFGEECLTVYWIQYAVGQPGNIVADENDAYANIWSGGSAITYLEAYDGWGYSQAKTIQERPTADWSTGNCATMNFGLTFDGFGFGVDQTYCDGALSGLPVICNPTNVTGGWGEVYRGTGHYQEGVAPNDVTQTGSNEGPSIYIYYAWK